MQDLLTISLDGLKEGQEVPVEIVTEPSFLDMHEPDYGFEDPVTIQGTLSLNKESLLFRALIRTEAIMSCAICNERTKVKIEINNFCHLEERSELKTSLFSLRDLIRDTILLELPYRTECNSGCCRERATLAKFLKHNE